MILADWTLETLVDKMSGERMDVRTHRSGLVLLHIPKPGFIRRFGGFAIPYGSVHTSFVSDVEHRVPDGTAHYLEHCVFTRDDQGGLLSALSATGAQANAYTTHSHTLYYFTATDSFETAFAKMLDAVLRPSLDQDRVEAERPIILSELAMYRDEPDSRCFTGLLESLYAAHPVRVDIGGTAESVARISPEHLRAVHDAYYAPSRMILAVVGDLEPQTLMPLVEAAVDGIPRRPEGRTLQVEEPPRVPSARTEIRMDVGMPSFLIGIKDPSAALPTSATAWELALRRRAGRLLFETLLGSTSDVFDDLYAEGLLTDSFGFHYLCEEDFAFLAAGGESPEPEKAAAALLARMRETFAGGLDARAFDTQRKAAAGSFLRGLDSIEGCGLSALHAALAGIGLFDSPGIYDSMVLEQAADWMRFILDEDLASVSLVLPAGGE